MHPICSFLSEIGAALVELVRQKLYGVIFLTRAQIVEQSETSAQGQRECLISSCQSMQHLFHCRSVDTPPRVDNLWSWAIFSATDLSYDVQFSISNLRLFLRKSTLRPANRRPLMIPPMLNTSSCPYHLPRCPTNSKQRVSASLSSDEGDT